MASVIGTVNDDTIGVGSASEGVAPQTGASDSEDVISGLAGSDSVAGGAGNDTFVLGAGDGDDNIEDFVQGEDKIDLDGQDVSFEELVIEDVEGGGTPGKKISVNDDSLTLAGFTGELTADDFIGLNESIDGARVTGTDDSDVIITGFASTGVVNAPDDTFGTTNDADSVTGEGGDDTLTLGGGNDTAEGGDGNDAVLGDGGADELSGDTGEDTLFGGEGDDTLAGGAGNDEVTGGPGIDRFAFDPSNAEEGNDTVSDFAVGEDLISLRAADILNATPALAELSPEALDRSEDWTIAGSEDTAGGEDTSNGEDTANGGDGDVVITHPGGAITLGGVAFGDATDSFAELSDAGALETAGLVVGTADSEDLTGTEMDDVIDALGGSDTLTGGSGNDILSGGADGDDFAFDPSNQDEGDDRIVDFTFQVVTDTGQRDFIALNSTQVLAADPDLAAANNDNPDNPDDDENLLTLDDFDASANWNVGASENGWLSISHPGGSIELVGMIASADASFNDLAPSIKVDGAVFPDEGISLSEAEPEEPTAPEGEGDGETGGDGEAGGEGGTGGDGGEEGTGGDGGTDTIEGDDPGAPETAAFDSLAAASLADADAVDEVDGTGDDGEPAADDEVGDGETGGDGESEVEADAPLVTGTDGNDVIVTGFASTGVVNEPDSASGTTIGADSVSGEGGDDTITGGAGDDTVDGGAGSDALLGDIGNDDLSGGEGDDTLLGGDGEDILAGGAGNDELTGGAGIDRFVFDPSNTEEGDDTVSDFAVGEDLISLRAADILNASPDLSELSAEALDRSEDWTIEGSEDTTGGEDTANGEDTVNGGQSGDVVITHPGGTITLEGVALGDATDSFVELADAGALEIAGLVVGTAENDDLAGTGEDDVIDALAGDDTLSGGSGDDILSGGSGGDDFAFDPSNEEEGNDRVLDFTLQVITDTGERDYIALNSGDVLAADPDLAAANNGDLDNPDDDENLLTLDDFDASENWGLGTSEDGWLSIIHPNGTIELVGIRSNGDASFNDLAPSIKVDGALFPEEGIALGGTEPEQPSEPEQPDDPAEPEAFLI